MGGGGWGVGGASHMLRVAIGLAIGLAAYSPPYTQPSASQIAVCAIMSNAWSLFFGLGGLFGVRSSIWRFWKPLLTPCPSAATSAPLAVSGFSMFMSIESPPAALLHCRFCSNPRVSMSLARTRPTTELLSALARPAMRIRTRKGPAAPLVSPSQLLVAASHLSTLIHWPLPSLPSSCLRLSFSTSPSDLSSSTLSSFWSSCFTLMNLPIFLLDSGGMGKMMSSSPRSSSRRLMRRLIAASIAAGHVTMRFFLSSLPPGA